jgi:hypothetical protein
LSLLFYDKPGDHIGWHFDHKFYWGRHFTMLVAIHNEGRAAGGLSHAILNARVGGGATRRMKDTAFFGIRALWT